MSKDPRIVNCIVYTRRGTYRPPLSRLGPGHSNSPPQPPSPPHRVSHSPEGLCESRLTTNVLASADSVSKGGVRRRRWLHVFLYRQQNTVVRTWTDWCSRVFTHEKFHKNPLKSRVCSHSWWQHPLRKNKWREDTEFGFFQVGRLRRWIFANSVSVRVLVLYIWDRTTRN